MRAPHFAREDHLARLDSNFRSFVATQFFGSFNDNLFKQLALFLAARVLFPGQDVQGVALAIFALPFVLFSGLAGDLSERFGKQRIMVQMKRAEIAIMVAGAIALQLKSWPMLLIVLFLMGTHSAFFGPAKYGSIPELVGADDLVRANGITTMTTFVSVLLAGALAGPLLDALDGQLWVTGLGCLAIAGLGLWTALRIRDLPAQNPRLVVPWNPFGSMWSTVKSLRAREGLLTLVFLNSAFYFNAAVVQSAIVGLGAPKYLDIGQSENKLLSFVLASLSAAVGIGSLVAPRLARKYHPGKMAATAAVLTFVGQLGFNLVGPVLSRGDGALWVMHACAIWVGVFGAAMIVPVVAFMQHAPPAGTRGQVFGLTNFSNFLFIFLSAAYYQVFRLPSVDLSPALATTGSGLVLVIAVWISRKQLARLNFD
jgi:acyl-[acyl-carrier-protein]-phospholipid O-acyltransferase/long-chain-fatty-acid--[acyl-carrier-protein] ligase